MAGKNGVNWKTSRLGDVANVLWGDTSTTKASYTDSGFPAYSASGCDGFLPYADFNRTGIVVSAIGAECGKTWLAKGKWSCIKNTIRFWSTDPEVDTEFLYWATSNPNDWPKRGSAQPFISQGDARAIAISYPSLSEQRAIASILGSLDDLIELNQETNELLEKMARALFKSWFVDFDPVRAKLEGRPPAGMDAAVAALFPEHFQDSELGQIPSGWEVKPLASLASYLSRGIGPSYVESGGVCVLNQKCIRNHRVDFTKSRRHCVDNKAVDGRLLKRGDILVNSTGMGTLGRVAQIFDLAENTIVDSHVTVVRASPGVDPSFLGQAITSREAEIEELGEGSTGQTELSRTRLGALAIVVSGPEIQRAFGRIIEPTLNLISENDRESCDLANLRDTLLPKLLSGEITVPVAEELVAAAS